MNMANFAYIQNGAVVNIIIAEQEVIDTGLFGSPTDFVEYTDVNPAYIGQIYSWDEPTLSWKLLT